MLSTQLAQLKSEYDSILHKYNGLKGLEPNFGENYENNCVLDREFFMNTKLIKDKFDEKQSKNDRVYSQKVQEISSEFLKELNRLTAIEPKSTEESIPKVEAEELFAQMESKIASLYREIQEKDNYILIVEQKYEMASEENSFIKRKIDNEKAEALKQLEALQVEMENMVYNRLKEEETRFVEDSFRLETQIEEKLSKAVEEAEKVYSLERENFSREVSRQKMEISVIKETERSKIETEHKFNDLSRKNQEICDELTKVNLIVKKQGKEVSDLGRRNEDLKRKNTELNDNIGSLTKKIGALSNSLKEKQTEIEALQGNVKERAVVNERELVKLLETYTDDKYFYNESKIHSNVVERLGIYLKKSKEESKIIRR